MGGKPWFRPKAIGFGLRPSSWEGWLSLLGLLVVVISTMVLLGDPSASRPDTAESLMRLRAALGLSGISLPLWSRFALVAAEVLVFWLFARTRTAPD